MHKITHFKTWKNNRKIVKENKGGNIIAKRLGSQRKYIFLPLEGGVGIDVTKYMFLCALLKQL